MKTNNIVILEGHLGKDAEIKTAGSGEVATFSIAVSDDYKPKDKDWIKRSYWFNIVSWDKVHAGLNLVKGSKVCIKGKLVSRSWEKDGIKKFATEIVAESIGLIYRPEKTEPTEGKGTPIDDLPF